MRKLRMPPMAFVDKVAKAKWAREKILKVAEKAIDNTVNPNTLASMRTDICHSITQGVAKDIRSREVKPSLDEACAELTESPQFMRVCSKLGISEDDVRDLVQKGLDSC